ncbi:MAG TPA: cation:proton antiporter [Candidatus Binatia bacterium]|jgi:CPA2 family monovalent cation:H+ antiporter-2
MPETVFYRDLAYVFVAAVLGGLLAKRLGQPSIMGYVLGGILVGPFTPGPTLSDIHNLELFAEIGVILLMYSIGMEFSVRDLLTVKWVALIGGPLGLLLVIGLAVVVGRLLDWGLLQSIIIGAVTSLASTMVLSQLLIDRRELHSEHGRAMIGITLVDDLAFVLMVVLVPVLTSLSGSQFLSIAGAFGEGLLILAPVIFIAAKLVPRLMARIPDTRDHELRILIALALGFATAAATQALGLSLALGAFLAGMIVSQSEVGHEILNDLLPLRNSFVALFFVTIGTLINPGALVSNPALLAGIVAVIVLGKLAIWTAVVSLFRYPLRTALLVGVGLTQIGEFSYVLIRVARDSGLVATDVYSAVLAASLLTILLNAILIRAAPGWLDRFRLTRARSADAEAQTEPAAEGC